MTPEQFKERLSQDIAAIGARHTAYSNDGQRFTHWVLESVFRLSDAEARAANFDGTGDGGLDGFFIDQNEDLLRLVQCKYSETIERDARDAFVTLPHKLKSSERIAESNPSIYDCSLQFKEGLERNLDVHMTFVFLGQNRGEYTDEIKALVKSSLPTEEAIRYEIEVVGMDELILRYAARNPFGLLIPHSKTLQFESNGVLNYEKGSIKGLVMNVNGRELARFGDSPEMFLANFRYFLDARNKVNAKISDTIQETPERPNIWAYNNGVTIICDRFDDPDLVNKTVRVYSPQIVNGCQTVSTLKRPVANRFAEHTSFLVRVIASADANLKTRIATYTNSQTKVTDRTLRSNDPIQRDLQDQFRRWTPNYFYDCKDGEWDSLPTDHRQPFHISGKSYRRISNIDAAKAFIAFHGKPIEAKSNPKSIWDLSSQGLYNFVFPSERSAEELLLPFLISERFTIEIEALVARLGPSATGDSAVVRDYLVHADTTLMALAGHIIDKWRPAISRDILRTLITRSVEIGTNIFERCNSALKYEVLRARTETEEAGQLFNPRNFFLRTVVFQNAKNKIDSDIDLLTEAEYFRRCGLTEN